MRDNLGPVSRQKLSPHCLATVCDSQLPSPKLVFSKMPPKLPQPPGAIEDIWLKVSQTAPVVRVVTRQFRTAKIVYGEQFLHYAASRCLSGPYWAQAPKRCEKCSEVPSVFLGNDYRQENGIDRNYFRGLYRKIL